MSYGVFAQYYDSLTKNVGYSRRAAYFCTVMQHLKHDPGLTLDLACGTGSLTIELAKRGIDVYGVDGSMEMLSVAQQKAAQEELPLLFLQQTMQSLDLYGTVNTVICALDSINHLTSEAEVQKAFERVSLFLEPQTGLFLFDANTPYKHQFVLGNNVFVYDMEEVFCVWQNRFEEAGCRIGVELDFFSKEGKLYRRSKEQFYERAYSLARMTELLHLAGLKLEAVYGDMRLEPPTEREERIILAARKY